MSTTKDNRQRGRGSYEKLTPKMKAQFKIKKNETEEDYKTRICDAKFAFGFNWDDVAKIVNDNLGTSYGESAIRKPYMKNRKMLMNSPVSQDIEGTVAATLASGAMKYEMQQQAKEMRKLVRENAKNISNYNTAIEVATILAEKAPLLPKGLKKVPHTNKASGILTFADWHLGIEFENYHNKFNTKIATARVHELVSRAIDIGTRNKVRDLYVVNLGDMIAGNIHPQIRIESEMDAISQGIVAEKLIIESLLKLSEHFNIFYYSVTDNHSRVNPNKDEAYPDENFARTMHHSIQNYFYGIKTVNPVKIIDNEISPSTATFNIDKFKVCAVHGDKDKKKKAFIECLSTNLQEHFDLILSAHDHHLEMTESNKTLHVSSGSLMGTDTYARDLRLNSNPSQMMLVLDANNKKVESMYKIDLEDADKK